MKIYNILFFIVPCISANTFNCKICNILSKYLSNHINYNITKNILEKVTTKVCIRINAGGFCDSSDCINLCNSIVHEYSPYVIEKMKYSLDTKQICEELKICPINRLPIINNISYIYSNITNYEGEQNWTNWENNSDIGYFIQITDIHLDKYYEVGASTDCNLPICCRQIPDKNLDMFNDKLSGFWGSLNKKCDIPIRLSEELHHWFNKTSIEADFVFYTGDAPPHDIWDQSKEENIFYTKIMNDHLMIPFKNIPVFQTFGNHDFYPVDMIYGDNRDNWLYNRLLTNFDNWMSDESIKTIKFGGFYSQRCRNDLRVISLNSLSLTNHSLFHTDYRLNDWPDPYRQMAWLNDILQQSNQLGEKIIFIFHHPFNDWNIQIQNYFKDLLKQYSHNIILLLGGHTHNNFPELYDEAINLWGYISGSLTTYGEIAGNPSFNRFKYNRTSYEIIDIEYWILDIEYFNNNLSEQLVWNKKYSALKSLNMTDLSYQSWKKLLITIKKDNNLDRIYKKIYYKI